MPTLLSNSIPSSPPTEALTFWEEVKEHRQLKPPSEHFIYNSALESRCVSACVERYIHNPPQKVLDLGGGIGANSLPMAKNGAYVTVIDRIRPLLVQISRARKKANIPKENIRLVHRDITDMERFGANYHLVIAVDIFPYLAPSALEGTMTKIYNSMADKGILVGTISTGCSVAEEMQPILNRMGHHIYHGDQIFVRRFLEEVGLTAQKIVRRADEEGGGYLFRAQKIMAQTPAFPLSDNIAYRPDPFVQECIGLPPKTVLDLGSGVGANSLPMAKNGSAVIVIEKKHALLEELGRRCLKENIKTTNVARIHNNLTEMESFGTNYDLVLAMNILTYIPRYTLRETMLKIYQSMSDGGILIGTLVTSDSLEKGMQELAERMGQHVYEGGQPFIKELLEEAGLTVQKMEKRSPENTSGYNFCAQKVSRPMICASGNKSTK